MNISILGQQLSTARKRHYPNDTLADFAMRIGISRATYQKMEKGDLSVTLGKYYKAATLLNLNHGFESLFAEEDSLFDD